MGDEHKVDRTRVSVVLHCALAARGSIGGLHRYVVRTLFLEASVGMRNESSSEYRVIISP
jgi:hypothetical protein